ncbi:TetR/AcrR family transcriptional regulator [Brevundimonas sp.]|uniref:TetR/AcrR family transcriptional regulator n=1 Tax=Brevundimonas sp. TaxID=1871086 RepID=UPI003D139FC6
MPRVAGQIDARKSEAILEAATALFAEKGVSTSMEEIARRAGVSKQTLYNRYASKVDIGRALAERRSDLITAPLRSGADPETVLTALAAAMLEKVFGTSAGDSLRGVALMAPQAPDLAEAVYHAGPGESLRRLALWLADQDRAGVLRVPDPDLAAEMFTGLAVGYGHLRLFMGVAGPPVAEIPRRAREAAQRFLKAFAA